MSEVLSRSLLNWLLGYIQTASDEAAAAQADRIEASHELLLARVEKLETALREIATGDEAGFGVWFIDTALDALEADDE